MRSPTPAGRLSARLGPARLAYFLHKLHSSFWFVPACFGVAAFAGALCLLWVDARWGTALLDGYGPPFTMERETARQLLATLAGAVVTVVGLIFSLTLVALTLAAGNLGVRLLDRYMRNPVTHGTMGLFIGTFIFVIVVLSGLGAVGEAVPRFSVLASLVLSGVCVVWLGFTFHDLAQRLQIDHEAAQIAKALNHRITKSAAAPSGWLRDECRTIADDPTPSGTRIDARVTGYVQSIDFARLAAFAAERNSRVTMTIRQGDYVIPTDPVAWATGDDGDVRAIRATLELVVTIGAKRTSADDLLFDLHLLLEIAARALSPGINDLYTALNCIDHVTGCIAHALGERLQRLRFASQDGRAEVRTRSPDTLDLIETACESFRQNVRGHPAAVIRAIDGLGRLAPACRNDSMAAGALLDHVERLRQIGADNPEAPAIAAAADRAAARLRLACPAMPAAGG